MSLPNSTAPIVSLILATSKQEKFVVIKSQLGLSIVEMEEQVEVKVEPKEREPTTFCCGVFFIEGPCSQELVDVTSTQQRLSDIVSVQGVIINSSLMYAMQYFASVDDLIMNTLGSSLAIYRSSVAIFSNVSHYVGDSDQQAAAAVRFNISTHFRKSQPLLPEWL